MTAVSPPAASVGRRRRSYLPSRMALRVFEHNFLVFRRALRSYVLSSLLQPFLFLVSMGVGLGVYVNRAGPAALGGVTYLQFVAPALLVSQAMMTAAFESAFPIMSKFEWSKSYWAALNTPIGVADLLPGELLWVTFRLTLLSVLFLVVVAAVGAVVSPLIVLAVPVAVLTGLAFAAPIMAFTATQKRDSGFNALFRFGITPLFLFSGTFFPIERLPGFIQPLAWATPLYHGVSLGRALALGHPELAASLVHLAFLTAFVVAGLVAGTRTYRRRLEV